MIATLLDQIERDAAALGEQLRAAYPTAKRPEINIILQSVKQMRERHARLQSPQASTWRPGGAPISPEETERCASKKAYATPEAAGRAAASAHAQGSTDELRVYACRCCRGYHLTHLSLEDFAAVEERAP